MYWNCLFTLQRNLTEAMHHPSVISEDTNKQINPKGPKKIIMRLVIFFYHQNYPREALLWNAIAALYHNTKDTSCQPITVIYVKLSEFTFSSANQICYVQCQIYFLNDANGLLLDTDGVCIHAFTYMYAFIRNEKSVVKII